MEGSPPQAHDHTLGLADPGSFELRDDGLSTRDPLSYEGYPEMLAKAAERARVDESVVTGMATIGGHRVELAVFRFDFLGGSMGEVAGERLARAMERAAKRRVPFVLRTATGGARMQEGMRSLIQMPKVVAARLDLADAHEPFIAVLGHPTTGGVLASLAALADVTIAEEGATVGFAGPRVAESFTGEALPPGSHTARSAFEHGLVDALVDPAAVVQAVGDVLRCLEPGGTRPEPPNDETEAISTDAIDAWDSVRRARDPQRPHGRALLAAMSESFVELRGDRGGHDDSAVIAGIARVQDKPIMAIALDPEQSPLPAGYRKTCRCLRIAERLGLPVVTLIDTRGADPSARSEAAGIAWTIGRLFEAMLTLRVPSLAVVTGEGGSGGALAFAAADRVVAFEDSIFSVIAPEGAAEILWRDASRAPEAARALRLTASDLKELGIADEVVAAPLEAASLKKAVTYHLDLLLTERSGDADPSAERRMRWRKTW